MATAPDQASYRHVIPLDFASVKTLPDSCVWPESDEVYSGTHQPSIPVIGLMEPNATELIIQACETWGVFQLIGHGIPKKLVESEAHRLLGLNLLPMFSLPIPFPPLSDADTCPHYYKVDTCQHLRRVVMEWGGKTWGANLFPRLFALPADRKLKTLRTPGKASSRYGNPPSQSLLPRKLWHEGFTIMGSPIDQATVLWPHDYQGFCAALQLNSYPPCPDRARAVGLAPHNDSSLFTILHSRTEGLQIFKEGLGWIIVQPNPDALTVNVGDLLQILSNGRFVSVHRAVVNQKYHRISVAYLCWPPRDFIVSPLLSKTLADSGQVPKYRPVTLKEYSSLKAKHFQDAISFVSADT